MCPSATCHSGALLLGVVQSNKKVILLPTPMEVTDDFVEKAVKAGDPEKRLRFAGNCAKSGCSQWTGSRCGVIDKALTYMNESLENAALPECSIRPQCRWYSQTGADACKVCPFIITDTR
jgi:hypothetical protein